MSLCDKCKKEFEPNSVLTFMGKAQLAVQVAMRRGRKINWDTLSIDWRDVEAAKPIITFDEMR